MASRGRNGTQSDGVRAEVRSNAARGILIFCRVRVVADAGGSCLVCVRALIVPYCCLSRVDLGCRDLFLPVTVNVLVL